MSVELDPDDRRTLETAQPMRWDEAAALAELRLLDDAGHRPPASLPMCSQAIARRLQLEILREELRPIAQAVRSDEDAGSAAKSALRVAERVEKAGEKPSAGRVVELSRAAGTAARRSPRTRPRR